MSDCFDHEADAWDDLCFNSDRYAAGYTVYGYGRKSNRYTRTSFSYDPDYYHQQINFSSLLKETENSYYIELYKAERGLPSLNIWLPKKICKALQKNAVKVHSATYSKIIKEAVAQYKLTNAEAIKKLKRGWS